MPGIVGLITGMGREYAEPQLQRMVRALRHEDFYDVGTWTNEAAGIYVGWISRQDAYPGGRPLKIDSGATLLFLSGEDFSGPQVPFFDRSGHDSTNHRSSLLTELVNSKSFPENLNGRFQGLLVDAVAGTARLFNDRYGLHRLYFHEGNEAFYFAAEAKAILAVRPELRSIDPRGLGELVSNGCVLENRTVFRGIGVLPPASVWSFRKGGLDRKGTYFESKAWEDQEPLPVETYYRELREVFSGIIPKYFGGDRQVAISLTGGIDSRLILAWLDAPPDSIQCFSFGGPFRDCHDVRIAQKVANLCHQPHRTIYLGQEFLEKFPHYSERTVFLTDGCVSVMHSPDLYINEIARTISPVRMTGNYGSEVLRGHVAFRPGRILPGVFSSDFSPYIDLAQQTYANQKTSSPVSFAAFRQAPWHHYGLLSLEETQLSVRTPYFDNKLVQTVFRAPVNSLNAADLSIRLIKDGNPALAQIPTDRGLTADSGPWGRLRHEYDEFTFKAEYAYDYGMPQWVSRIDHSVSWLHLERLFLGRHKFYHFRVWYRDALSNYVREMLLDPLSLSRSYVNRKSVEAIVEGHLRLGRNYTTEIHKLLSLELLHRLLIDGDLVSAST
jgi:asparagine synthase (glutamine-hydrolysing)